MSRTQDILPFLTQFLSVLSFIEITKKNAALFQLADQSNPFEIARINSNYKEQEAGMIRYFICFVH